MKRLKQLVLVFAAFVVIALLALGGSVAASFGKQSRETSTDKTDRKQGMQMCGEMRARCMQNMGTGQNMPERCRRMIRGMQGMGTQEGMSERCTRMMGRNADVKPQEDTEQPAMGSMCR